MMNFGPAELIIILAILLLLAIVVGGAIVLGIVLFSRRNKQAVAEPPGAARIPCPFCAELILPEAKVCRFCGRELPARYKMNQQEES